MAANLFDHLDDSAVQGEGRVRWAPRAPYRPHQRHDLMLVPRVKGWQEDAEALAALDRIAADPDVAEVAREGDQVWLRLEKSWVERAGSVLEEGDAGEAALADLAAGEGYAVYFWGANTTKALHIGHLRNLAIGHALGAALQQAGARVERRSLICDVGRSMGEAMAGVVHSGRDQQVWPEGEEKSDHFVGACYADYVTAGRAAGVVGAQDADDG